MARICFITHSEYPREPRARRMAEALVARGHTVDVLCLRMPGQAAEELMDEVRIVRLPETRHQGAGAVAYLKEYARFFFLAGTALLKRHRQARYALVQVHNPPDALAFCALPLRLRRVPVVLDLRELMPELFMSRFGLARKSLVVRVLTLLERWACRYASRVIVLHDRHERIMAGRGIPVAKLTQVMNCPDERFFGGGQRPQQPRPDNVFTVINNGGIFWRYGSDLLARAVALARPEIPGIRLEWYGEGDYRPQIDRLIAELDLAEVVRFHGQRPIEEMPTAILSADVGVAPLRQDVFTDCALPTKLLEFVALGVPAIASRTATTADYFDDSMILLFEPGNAEDLAARLCETYREPTAAQRRAACARAFTAGRNWRGESARYVEAIEQLLPTEEGKQ